MPLTTHAASVPVFQQMLGALDCLLEKSEAHVADRRIDPAALLQARLFPDMFTFTRQVQIACDFARGVSARLAGVDVPIYEDKELSFGELRTLVGKTIAFIGGLDASQFDASEDREVVTRPGTPRERTFKGQAYLLTYGLPQFFFHVTTAYALLRHNGIEIGKRDYMGKF
jgi:hypothetical protein